MRCPCVLGLWPTRLMGRKTGRHPKWPQKYGCRGSGSPLTRAFEGSKPLLVTSMPASGHTVLTIIFGDRWQTDALGRMDNLHAPLAQKLDSMSWNRLEY